MKPTYEFNAPLTTYSDSSWHFVYIPKNAYAEIRELASPLKRGFGSVRVEVTVGSSVWRTSLFPDSKAKQYILFIKKAVRVKEGLEIGDTIIGTAELVDF